MTDLWKNVVAELEKTLPSHSFTTWIQPIRCLRFDGERIVLQVPNRFFADWLQENSFLDDIRQASAAQAGRPVTVDLKIEKTTRPYLRPDEAPPPEISAAKKVENWQVRARRLGLNPKYTFDSFVVGSSNQFAHAASLAVAEKAPRTYNPLFIYGGTGLGKTHLLNAIGNFKISNYRESRVCYVHSETFINEMIQALANKKMPEFRDKYRRMDVLLIDDIQFIAGKERTQEEFFHTFNALYEGHGNIVVTSDKFPKEIPGLEERLRSRFEWGLIADIQPPDMETKVAILQKKAELESIPLPYEVAVFLASNCSSNVRELEGSLVRVAAFASLTHAEISVDLSKEVLKDVIRDAGREVTVERILKVVASHYHVTVVELKGKKRTKNLAHPRQMAMYLAREFTGCSFPEIGQKIGNRDHSTVMYACSKIAGAVETNEDGVREQVKALRTTLGV